MMRQFVSMAAAGALMAGAAFAQEEVTSAAIAQGEEMVEEEAAPPPEPVAQHGECALYNGAPEMPNPKEASVEDRVATIEAIKAFQAALSEYRACLDTISGNEELEVEAREAALKEFNRTVKVETDMVEDWQKFDKKYQKANK